MLEADRFRTCEDEVVQNYAPQALGGCNQPAGRKAIRCAWPDVTTWMIVGQKNPRASTCGGVGNDRPYGKADFRNTAAVPAEVKAIRLTIDVCDPQALSSGIGLGKAARKERAGRFRSVQLERLCGTLIAHPA